MGQFYTPLSIGTAKPDLSKITVAHHLFNILDRPVNFTVMDFRGEVISIMNKIWKTDKIPVIVGGSGFYIKALYFMPCESQSGILQGVNQEANKATVAPMSALHRNTQELWTELSEIDPMRAKDINPNDRYRIQRALKIWYDTGIKPSECRPLFKPIGTSCLIFLNRDRKELYERINERVAQMFKLGWLDEVRTLDADWKNFLLEKKLIGYPEVISLIDSYDMGTYGLDTSGVGTKACEIERKLDALNNIISQKTRAYAKRQLTFWQSLKRELQTADIKGSYIENICEINLTLLDADLYIDKLVREIDG